MEKVLLIDASAIIYRFFFALPPLTTPEHEPIQGIYGLANILFKILSSEEKPTYIAAALDRPEPTLRKQKFQDYKNQRPPAPDALISQLKRMPEVFSAFGIKIFEKAGYEADDVLGTLSENLSQLSDLKIFIMSGDLDILQLVKGDIVVGQILTSGMTNTEIYNEARVQERYGLKPNQLKEYKSLIGDASDNIPGIKGVGPKTASQLLKEFGTLENIYENLSIITPSVAKKLENKKEEALLYRNLVTIDTATPITVPTLNELALTMPDKARLESYFMKLGFVSLASRIKSI